MRFGSECRETPSTISIYHSLHSLGNESNRRAKVFIWLSGKTHFTPFLVSRKGIDENPLLIWKFGRAGLSFKYEIIHC